MKTFILLSALLLAAPAMAQEMDHSMHHMPAMPKVENAAPSTAAYDQAFATMHKNMAITYTGNADVDFATGMIPHHQGAIDMAKVELQYGQDPEIRKLAEGVIKAQEAEIAFMKAWLAKQPKK